MKMIYRDEPVERVSVWKENIETQSSSRFSQIQYGELLELFGSLR